MSALQVRDHVGRPMESHFPIAQLAENCVLRQLLAVVPHVAGSSALLFTRRRFSSPANVSRHSVCLEFVGILEKSLSIVHTYQFIYFLSVHAFQMLRNVGCVAAAEIQHLLAQVAKGALVI